MKRLILQVMVCFSISGFCLYSYLDEQNSLTQVKMRVPQKEKEIQMLAQENRHLMYQVDQFESPGHLIDLAQKIEFRHLKHPPLHEVLTVPEAVAVISP